MNIFLLGGWVARPSAFYFCVVAGSLPYSVWLGRSVFCFCLALFCLLGFSLPLSLFPAFSVDRVLPRLSVLILTALCWPLPVICVPVPGIPSISASLG